MSAETAFIDAVATYLAQRTGVATQRVGPVEPATAGELPSIVLSLPEVHRLSPGLGERAALITGGALPVRATIDLANPVLPEEPGFRLLSDDRLTLVLPHGGQVKADATVGPLAGADLQVTVAGTPRTVVNAPPGAGQVRPDAATGTLTFGAALPATGQVVANYFLGQWERRVTPIAGRLRIDVRATSAAQVQTLSATVADAMDDAGALPRGLRKVALGQLGSILSPPGGPGNDRGRELHYSFEYEHEINRPDSSGGVIRLIPIQTRLATATVEPASGAIVTSITTEVSEVRP